MDSMSTAELIEIAQLFRDSLDAQFQYWLTTTFAVIVASFIAREKLDKKLRAVVSILYIVASILFYATFALAGENWNAYAAVALKRGAIYIEPIVSLRLLRTFLFISGTLITLWFLNFTKIEKRDDET